jgi:hypothetical protein
MNSNTSSALNQRWKTYVDCRTPVQTAPLYMHTLSEGPSQWSCLSLPARCSGGHPRKRHSTPCSSRTEPEFQLRLDIPTPPGVVRLRIKEMSVSPGAIVTPCLTCGGNSYRSPSEISPLSCAKEWPGYCDIHCASRPYQALRRFGRLAAQRCTDTVEDSIPTLHGGHCNM